MNSKGRTFVAHGMLNGNADPNGSSCLTAKPKKLSLLDIVRVRKAKPRRESDGSAGSSSSADSSEIFCKSSDTISQVHTSQNMPVTHKGKYNSSQTASVKPVSVTSSFKLSNRLPTLLNKATNKIPKFEKEEVDFYNERKLKYFETLQNSLTLKRRLLVSLDDENEKIKLADEIRRIENREEENEYFINTWDVISNYTTAVDIGNEETITNNQKNLVDDCDTIASTATNMTDITEMMSRKRNAGTTLGNMVTKKDNSKAVALSNDFFRQVDPTKISLKSLYFNDLNCETCKAHLYINNGSFSCSGCGTVSEDAVGDFQWSYKDIQETALKSTFAYKRLNRYKELLNSLQAKEHTEIPEAVVDAVRSELNKERVTNFDALNITKVRYYLKRTGNNKYYEHSSYIIDRIKGKPPLIISPEVEQKLIDMFISIQEPYELAKQAVHPVRTSFLSYMYVCYKFFELLGMHDKLEFFPLLKSREKLDVQDRIWKIIAKECNFTFYRST